MKSIISFPDRGSYGKSNYRGNTSGYVIRDLIEHFTPKTFVDVCEGGGTSRDVCDELGVQYVGLDLHTGFDFTRDSVLEKLGTPFDMVFSHPPYHNMINYSLERSKHGLPQGDGNDLSACHSVEEFLEKSQLMLLNQREATKAGGIYTTLIGDMRKAGRFYSFQSDFIKMMPRKELFSVTIKMQHNTMSAARSYNGKAVLIEHEYLIIFKKEDVTIAHVCWDKAKELQQNMNSTWRNYIRLALMNLGGKATNDNIYNEVEKIAGEKLKANNDYKAKVRQVLQRHFTSVERGTWAVAA